MVVGDGEFCELLWSVHLGQVDKLVYINVVQRNEQYTAVGVWEVWFSNQHVVIGHM